MKFSKLTAVALAAATAISVSALAVSAEETVFATAQVEQLDASSYSGILYKHFINKKSNNIYQYGSCLYNDYTEARKYGAAEDIVQVGKGGKSSAYPYTYNDGFVHFKTKEAAACYYDVDVYDIDEGSSNGKNSNADKKNSDKAEASDKIQKESRYNGKLSFERTDEKAEKIYIYGDKLYDDFKIAKKDADKPSNVKQVGKKGKSSVYKYSFEEGNMYFKTKDAAACYYGVKVSEITTD